MQTGNWNRRIRLAGILWCIAIILGACGASQASPPGHITSSSVPTNVDEEVTEILETDTPEAASSASQYAGKRDNTPIVLEPTADGIDVHENDVASIDASHCDQGYIMVKYSGSNKKVKLQISGPDGITYRYNLEDKEYAVFPLTSGNGNYSLGVYENISSDSYSTALKMNIDVAVTDEFLPYLYPNQYVSFTADSSAVEKAKELAGSADSDLDVVSNVYNYIIQNISYDHDKAAAPPPSGYTCDVDITLEAGTGICLDYAAVMASMLRSQHIPTRLEVGYAKDAYHAWISTYIKDKGWINGIVEFDGKDWKLMDPTFAANSSEKSLQKFIGDGSNYTVKYVY